MKPEPLPLMGTSREKRSNRSPKNSLKKGSSGKGEKDLWTIASVSMLTTAGEASLTIFAMGLPVKTSCAAAVPDERGKTTAAERRNTSAAKKNLDPLDLFIRATSCMLYGNYPPSGSSWNRQFYGNGVSGFKAEHVRGPAPVDRDGDETPTVLKGDHIP